MISHQTNEGGKNDPAHPRRVFLLGTDISKSISPSIQNAAFDKLKINARYELKELRRNELKDFVSSISKSQDVLGFNLTFPFKEEVIKLISSCDLLSKSIGAVNTVSFNKAHGMRGFNTDYDGVVATLKKMGAFSTSSNRNKNVLVIGAGGASRACIFALLKNGYTHVSILNRTIEKAELVSKQFRFNFPRSKIHALPLTKDNLSKSLEHCAIVINAISGSNARYFPVEIDFSSAEKDAKFFDLGYRADSLFLDSVRRNGFKAINGLLMLVVQAAKSFEIWTGRKAPMRTMMLESKLALDSKAST